MSSPRLMGAFFAICKCNLQLGHAQICSSEELPTCSNLEDARLHCRFWRWNLPCYKKYACASCRKPDASFDKMASIIDSHSKKFCLGSLLIISNAMNTQFEFDFVVLNETQSLECVSMSVFQVYQMIYHAAFLLLQLDRRWIGVCLCSKYVLYLFFSLISR